MADPSSGFPWNKVQAARSYLLALKPWLGPIASTVTVVPVDRPPVDGVGWLVAPQTDEHGRLYLDRSFVQAQPLHVLSGALEHEYAKISRSVHSRLSWVGPADWDTIATPSFQLEIVDAMERERAFLTPMLIEKRLGRSQQFSLYDYDDWEVQGAPSIVDAGALTPSALGLPSGLSAENYARLLLEAREKASLEGEGPASDDADDGTPEEGSAGEDSSEESGEEGSGGASVPAGGEQSDSDECEAEASPTDEQVEEDEEDSDEDRGAEAATPGDGVRYEDNDEEGALEDEGLYDDDLEDDYDDFDDDDDSPCDPGEGLEAGGQEDGEEECQADPDMDTEDPDVDARLQAAMENPDTYAWSKGIPHYADEFSADIAPQDEQNAPETPAWAMSEALTESATLTMRHAAMPGSGIAEQNLQVAHDRLRSLGLSWEQHLSRVVSSCLLSERIKGASDLTYSQANPNQPEVGIRLMGMTDYAPKVTILQDVSGSMTESMGLAMDTISDFMTALVGRLQSRAEWVTFDVQVVQVGRSALMTKDVRKRWAKGGGGTNLGGIITALMGKGPPMQWRGRRIEVPDLLVISTDAQFAWPKERPSRAHKLVVVLYSERDRQYLPDWVDQSTELVIAED